MKTQNKDIRDDQIRIIGDESPCKSSNKKGWVIGIVVCLLLIAILLCTLGVKYWVAETEKEEYNSVFEEKQCVRNCIPADTLALKLEADSVSEGYIERKDTCINDVQLRLFIPHNAEMSLHIGRMQKNDPSVIFVGQAADVRADNGKIVGAFVQKGKPISWGKSKKGYCACINGKVYVGVAENTPLFEMATENEGYFFRNYGLVDKGKLVENTPKGKTIRRAMCQMSGQVFMVESLTRESFHDFAQALVDLGVNNAIYLVGSTAYGWSVDQDGITHEHGEDIWRDNPSGCPKNVSYIVWKRK
jgi:hypothetical protein